MRQPTGTGAVIQDVDFPLYVEPRPDIDRSQISFHLSSDGTQEWTLFLPSNREITARDILSIHRLRGLLEMDIS